MWAIRIAEDTRLISIEFYGTIRRVLEMNAYLKPSEAFISI